MRHVMVWAGALALLLGLMGCSSTNGTISGGSSSGSSATGSAVRVNLAWGARSRDGLNSALSCVISVADPTTPATSAHHWTVNRQADPAAYTETFVSPEIPAQAWNLSVSYYATADGAGAMVGAAQQALTATDMFADAKTVTIAGVVNALTVDASQTVAVNATKQLTCTATDKSGATVALAPGAVTWSVVGDSSTLTLTPDGQATGVAAGDAQVMVTVDGINSYNARVTVTAN